MALLESARVVASWSARLDALAVSEQGVLFVMPELRCERWCTYCHGYVSVRGHHCVSLSRRGAP